MTAGSVLIADDDALLRDTLGDCLEAMGLRVRLVSDGAAALGALSEHPADVLVSDVDMPGLTGFQVLDQVRLRWAALPVILMSARATPDLERAACAAGARILIAKPLDIRRFTTLVTSILN